jgi:asparagine synthase (glutamine-hydrolysing)
MPGLWGWVAAEPAAERSGTLERMLARWRGSGATAGAEGAGWALAIAGAASPPGLHDTPRVTVALLGRVSFAEPRFDAAARSTSAAQALAEAYAQLGEHCFAIVRGTFAAVIIDHATRSCCAAIDRMGVHSLYYAPVAGGLVFGTTADAVASHPEVDRQINLQSVFNYVYFHMVPGPETIFTGQRRIPPGGYIRCIAGAVEGGTYWKMAYHERRPVELAELEAEFRRLLEASVRKVLDGRAVGAFLSGGTDSSTVAGMLGRVTGAPAKTFSIGFAAEGYDEVRYARIAAQHFQTDHHEYYVTPDDVLALVQRVARHCDQPFGNASAVPSYYCARMARSAGVEILLAGDGGDELFGGNERYAKQAIFGLYDKVPGVLRRGLLEPALFAIPGGDRLAPVRKARSYVRQASVPMPGRLQTYNMLNRSPLDRVFSGEFLDSVDAGVPSRLLDAAYHGADAQGMLNRNLALDLEFTLADNDLYKVGRMCEMAGVDVAYPMLDDDLVAFSGTLPAHLKVRGTTLRWFFKRALRGFLPPEIITKQKHGFGLPVGLWMQTHAPLRELAYDAMRDFKSRRVMRADFVDEMIDRHQTAHAAYWGDEIWVLAILELWLQAHGVPRGRSLA